MSRGPPARAAAAPSAGLTRLAVLLIGLLTGCGSGGPGGGGELAFRGANLLLISVDTLRADRLGCYGYDKGTSPNLDALAAESVLFREVYSNSPKTASAHMSLFTSLLPSTHKVRNRSARLNLESPVLASNRLTLAQVLRRSGYWNAAVANGGNLDAVLGFGRGFAQRFESGLADISQLVDRGTQRLNEMRKSGQPGFLFFHTYQVHGPYLPPKPFMERFAPNPRTVLGPRVEAYKDLPFNKQWGAMNKGLGDGMPPYWEGKDEFGAEEGSYLSDLYDGEVAYTDSQLGLLLESLKRLGLYDDTIIVVLSDHGEEFLEHGGLEHDQLFRELLHVPLLIRLPGGKLGGTEVSGLASLLDVMPTLLELLELKGPPTMKGSSLVPAMLSGRTEGHPVVSERVMFPDDYKASWRNDSTAITFHAHQGEGGPGRLSAYDLRADPRETLDVAPTASFMPQATQTLYEALARAFQERDILDAIDAGATVTLTDAAKLEELEAMGYLGGEEGEPVQAPSGTPLDYFPDDG